jgi:ATP-dependent DNA ligase
MSNNSIMSGNSSTSSEQLVETLPTLYGTSSIGREKVWSSRILKNSENHGIYEIEHGQFGGKMQLTRRLFTEGKNLGRANATTALQQCTNELRKKWADKQNKEGYMVKNVSAVSTEATETTTILPAATENLIQNTPIYPMLAKTYESDKVKKNGIVFPCYVQPKLDGLRCLVYMSPEGEIITQSRTGGQFDHLDHIKSSPILHAIFNECPTIVLDGELYTRDIPFETLAGLIKKKKITEQDKKQLGLVGYHIYDYIDLSDLTKTFSARNELLGEFQEMFSTHPIYFVKSEFISKDRFLDWFQTYINDGYEGIMLRNKNSVYRQGVRSSDLQKYKEFLEDEYTIVDFTQGAGRDEGTIIWVCETPGGERFNVRPRGSVEYRRDLYQNGRKYLGAKLTVIFQELSTFGVPRFPVGKCVRIDC